MSQHAAGSRLSIGQRLEATGSRIAALVIDRPCRALERWIGATRIRESVAYWIWTYIALVIVPFAFFLVMEILRPYGEIENTIFEWLVALAVAIPGLAFFALLFLIREAKNQPSGWGHRDKVAWEDHLKKFDAAAPPNRDVCELFRNVHEYSFFNPSRIGHFQDLSRANDAASIALFLSGIGIGILVWLGHAAWSILVVWAVVLPSVIAKISIRLTYQAWREDAKSIRRWAHMSLQEGIRARDIFAKSGAFSLDAYARAVDKAMYSRLQVALGHLRKDMVWDSFIGIDE